MSGTGLSPFTNPMVPKKATPPDYLKNKTVLPGAPKAPTGAQILQTATGRTDQTRSAARAMSDNRLAKFKALLSSMDARFVIENRYLFFVSIIYPGKTSLNDQSWTKNISDLGYLAKEIKFPDLQLGGSVNEVVTPRGRWVYPDNGTIIGTSNDATITFWDTQYSPVDAFFLPWMEKVENFNTFSADFKAQITIDFYDNTSKSIIDGDAQSSSVMSTLIMTYTLQGAYPKFIDTPKCSNDDRMLKSRSVAFSVDRVIKTMAGINDINGMRTQRHADTVMSKVEGTPYDLSFRQNELNNRLAGLKDDLQQTRKDYMDSVLLNRIKIPGPDNRNIFKKVMDGIDNARNSINDKIDKFKDKAFEMETKVRGIKDQVLRPIEDINKLTDQAGRGLKHVQGIKGSMLQTPGNISKDIGNIRNKQSSNRGVFKDILGKGK